MTDATLTLSALLRSLQSEFVALSARCHVLQEVTATAIAPFPGLGGGTLAQTIIALQDLDAITQTLDDLAALAGDGADCGFARVRIDAEAVRSALRLESLSRRLLDGASAEDQQNEEFLL